MKKNLYFIFPLLVSEIHYDLQSIELFKKNNNRKRDKRDKQRFVY